MTKIEIFRKFHQNRKFSKFDINRNFLKILAIIVIFWKFYQNQKFSKFWPKSKFLGNLTEILIFGKFYINKKNLTKIWNLRCHRNFWKIWLNGNCSQIFQSKFSKLWKKSKFFENFDQNRKFSELWPILKFFENLTKINIFWKVE